MVLVVEDEIDARDTLRDVLEDEGYRVMVARDGNEALKHLTSVAPSLAKIPVLVTTSDPTRAPRGVPTLEKPIQIDTLLSLVALACGRA
jgi:two-component system, sensor histidine kinase and response regulator